LEIKIKKENIGKEKAPYSPFFQEEYKI